MASLQNHSWKVLEKIATGTQTTNLTTEFSRKWTVEKSEPGQIGKVKQDKMKQEIKWNFHKRQNKDITSPKGKTALTVPHLVV